MNNYWLLIKYRKKFEEELKLLYLGKDYDLSIWADINKLQQKYSKKLGVYICHSGQGGKITGIEVT